ncbi:hypothetical protein [Nocardiopsis potens]|uniref:hypothetical protein n=1 Tax=Nocardiopsis potens TaxID=1246458 RepID=UPI00034D57E9|nr:hypothetical protein [Nocardiopsis potens]
MKNARLLINSGGTVAASALLASLLAAPVSAEADLLRTGAGEPLLRRRPKSRPPAPRPPRTD